jgi:dipeptidyl aminopeptidase/acylaminoacyl peptidase
VSAFKQPNSFSGVFMPKVEQLDTPNAPYGTWHSPFTSDTIVADSVSLDQLVIDNDDIYWIEGRPREKGRCVLMRVRATQIEEVFEAPWNVRSRVHEYGGGAYLVDRASIYFSNFADQRLYRGSSIPTARTPPQALTETGTQRFADYVMDATRERLIGVCEDHAPHQSELQSEPINRIVAIDLAGNDGCRILIEGSDFYASPRLSPDGKMLAWLSWDHPNMPWDGCQLWQAAVHPDGSLGDAALIAGSTNESIFQPEWSPNGVLHFVSDRSGWWNLYRCSLAGVEPLSPMPAEFGRAQWNFGMSTYGFEPDGHLICSYIQNGIWQLAKLNSQTLVHQKIEVPFRTISNLKVGNGFAVFIGGAPDCASSVVKLNLLTGSCEILRRSTSLEMDPRFLSLPEEIEFPTSGNLTAHAFFYPPKNQSVSAPLNELPPLLVLNHGGPTSSATATLNLLIQFWTSRGFAVVDVNYGGSTGYGRAYRQRLEGQWGIVDVDDAIAAARFLVMRHAVDPQRLIVRGSSAGGYTALCALTFHDFFNAGASYYGISDLELLASDCHKFESRYLDRLIGPYPAEQSCYRERSPIHFTDQLSTPLILFQGLEDKVVPPRQSEAMFEALNAKGVPVAYLTFPEEQHGFRIAANIKQALEAELFFYAKIFGFANDDAVSPIELFNLS